MKDFIINTLLFPAWMYKVTFVSDGNEKQLLEEFLQCKNPLSLDGVYIKRYDNANTFNALTFLLVSTVWKGVTFKNNLVTLNSILNTDIEVGILSNGFYGNLPCKVVAFQNRKYNLRQKINGEILNIVTSLDERIIIDINILIPSV